MPEGQRRGRERRFALVVVLVGGSECYGDMRSDFHHGLDVGVGEGVTVTTYECDDCENLVARHHGCNEAGPVAEQLQRASIGSAGDAVIKIFGDLSHKEVEPQRPTTPIHDHTRARPVVAMRIRFDESPRQSVERWHSVLGGHPNDRVIARNDNGAPIRHARYDHVGQPLVHVVSALHPHQLSDKI